MSDPTIKELAVEIREIRRSVEEHHKTLYGNGSPGLNTTVDRINEWLTARRRMEKVVVASVITAAGTGVGSFILIAIQYANRLRLPLLAVVALAGLAGCTRIVAPGWSYTSIAQQKSLGLQFDPESGNITDLDYNTAADPAVEALAGIAAGAVKAGKP